MGEHKIKFPCEKIESHKDGFCLMYTVQRLDAIDGSWWLVLVWMMMFDGSQHIIKKREGNENEGKISEENK